MGPEPNQNEEPLLTPPHSLDSPQQSDPDSPLEMTIVLNEAMNPYWSNDGPLRCASNADFNSVDGKSRRDFKFQVSMVFIVCQREIRRNSSKCRGHLSACSDVCVFQTRACIVSKNYRSKTPTTGVVESAFSYHCLFMEGQIGLTEALFMCGIYCVLKSLICSNSRLQFRLIRGGKQNIDIAQTNIYLSFFQVIEVRNGPRWFIFPSNKTENNDATQLPALNCSSDQENVHDNANSMRRSIRLLNRRKVSNEFNRAGIPMSGLVSYEGKKK
jgi:hypothetical protein